MNTLWKDLRATMALGIPLVIAQVCMMAMSLTDAILVGRGVGTQALAAMALALSFANVPFIALFGLSSATSILVARAFGGGRIGELPAILRHGLMLSVLAAGVVGFFVAWLFGHLSWFDYLGQSPELIPIAKPYMYLYATAFVFMLCGGHCRAFCESQNKPWLPLYVILGSIAANAVLDYAFIYGAFGFPKLGLMGAGLATLLCAAAQFFGLVAIILKNRLNLKLGQLLDFSFTRAFVARHLRLGIPTALQIGIEIGAISIVAMFAGMIGAPTLAAHHITMQVASFSFMVPLGMSFATSIRISQAAGANDRPRVLAIIRSSMIFAALWTGLAGIVILVCHGAIPTAFTHDAEVVGIAAGFLIVAGLFQVFDGVQCTAIGALRGLKDVNAPTVIVVLIYWVMELPLAWVLCFHTPLGGLGVWLSMFFGLVLSATFLTSRLRRVAATKVLND
ncbi:MAG TPA: MATE family efflux transporter [Opitutales bacterium]|nr:MATE family efflux transporter [Opitutales bacterium]